MGSWADASLRRLPAIGLEELDERAALLTRFDRTYLMDVADAEILSARMPRGTRVLDIDGRRCSAYSSTYLDTGSLTSYLDSALGRHRGFKVRFRRYENAGKEFLEVKTTRAGQTVKERLALGATPAGGLTAEGERFVSERLAAAGITPDGSLHPVLQTRYQRTTLFLPESSSRVTIDIQPTWHALNPAASLTCPRLAFVETKTAHRTTSVDHLLWSLGHRPVSISKDVMGLATLNPALPRRRWERVLDDWFENPTPGTAGDCPPFAGYCA